MKKEKLQIILDEINSVKIAVLGDFCLDAYWFIDESKSEISVETGNATQPIRQQKYSLGGAGNVTNNLAAMGVADVRAFGVIGDDPFASAMVGLMEKAGISTNNLLIQQDNWSTHVYAKPYVADVEQNRIDFGNFNQLSYSVADQLIQNLKNEIHKVDLVIINEQVISGIHTDYFKQKLVELIQQFPDKKFIVDSRNYSDFYDGAYRKMNDTEAANLAGIKKDPSDMVLYSEVKTAAKTLFERFKKPLFVTRGDRGSLIIDENGITDSFGLLIISKIDSVGAGDSYLAGAATALAAGYSMEVAAEIGTYVAGVTVQKLFQTGTATPEEILQIGLDPDFVYRSELAEDIRQAKYIDNSEIECINTLPENLNIRYAIFDHDGTISTLREGWEEIMAPMMMKTVLGNLYQDADEALYHKVQTRVNEFIDKTTGIQTLVQMKGLVELVREFGFVPENEILDEFGYKKIYNEELLLMVKEREKKILRGELSLEDFTLKNAVLLLEKLYKAGIKLTLASGTDEEDVRNEARILGYDHLFEGRIYGAVGDVNKEAKKIVLDRILDMIGTSGTGKIAVFGDGPVEIRETHKRDGVSIGIASNEMKRHSLNESKRTRLIKAGADIIIPDFSQLSLLLKLLNI
ncbi:MAG: HAD family hydrolase [Prolixibacteraceae bacterium]|jgi:rfaE bifunctional protein kinase chain/domain|nr:HAD family hydrolase [Prolixibacteraceae bacterium]MBT6765216.1 HAD family hydrolase [Prolixibacteraceae bacterium]MBT6999483.1 HAD family hydrolase [Prolixibacteraceae bacterium]MBT7395873.1 HAD family hydrolase [Prolixibacteraceae bacterium]